MAGKNVPVTRNITFILLFTASIMAVTGFSMFLTTTTWYVITELDSASMLGLVLIVISVPRLIMMTYGGVVADNYKKTTIMFSTNLIQALLLLGITWLIWNDTMTIVLLLILAGLFGMLDAFFGPASTSMLPKIVERHQLQQANAYFQGVDQISFIAGPIIAGVIMETSSVTASYFSASILVALSALIIFPPFIKEGEVENTVKQSPFQNFKEGFAYVYGSSFLMLGLIILVTLNFFVFGTLHIAVPLLVDAYGGSPLNLSYMEVSLGVGMVTGTVILGNYMIAKKGRAILYGLIAALGFYLIFGVVQSLTMLTIILFFIGFSMAFVFIPFFTAAQEMTENRMTGRVMSLVFLAMNGFDPIAYAIVSILTTAGIPVQFILLGFGATGMIIAVSILVKAKAFQQIVP
ncbi:MFS transporter [Sinobaca qinghaiensis]|uniref:MFS transporter n=1 Tax=Sinobaca qinghaiensis TaxID=342944 RepID=A0A419V7A2_9BACL|nr:MFS transporter [Sinobaca qinghaiensis]RKD75947.1 MFS transporter [Sinobaca qinghaiensis]